MRYVMVLNSLALKDSGTGLTAIAISHVPFGRPCSRSRSRWEADRSVSGRDAVMFPGARPRRSRAPAGPAYTHSYFPITFEALLVGIGWAAANVSATATIADAYVTATRGRALGFNDTCAAGISVLVALATGPLISWAGLSSTGSVAILLAIPPLGARRGPGAPSASQRRAAHRNGRRQQRPRDTVPARPRLSLRAWRLPSSEQRRHRYSSAQDFGYTVRFSPSPRSRP